MGLSVIGFYLLVIVYFFVCLFLIMVILAQEGKGGGLSGLGGAAAIGETFGFGGAATALRKWTRNVAITFIVLTVVLTFWGEQIARSRIQQFRSGGAEAVPAAVPIGDQQGQSPSASAPATGDAAENGSVPTAPDAQSPVTTPQPQ